MSITIDFLKKETIFGNIKVCEYEYLANDTFVDINPIWYGADLPKNIKYCHYYKSGWGNEFRYVREEIGRTFILESTLGRSSAEFHPYIVLEDTLGVLYSYNLFYSGNWKLVLENNYEYYKLTIGFETDFFTTIKPGKNLITPKVGIFSTNKNWSKLRETWQNFTDHWMKKNELQQNLPIIWNHWWAYEDKNINEKTFLDNIDKAAEIGVDVCVLDAGWFGNNQHWFDVRGDWEDTNKDKFPNGLSFLSKKVHEKEMKFGFWIEIEGLGKHSRIPKTDKKFVARKDEKPLGYLCFGNQEVVKWALNLMSNIIENYQCDWIKFDFNLDPGNGCNCTAHGHGFADGLFAHYQGLYEFFSSLNEKYPEVVFENCSSGGLRTDLGLLSNMHFNYLSDPDYPDHKERCVRNAGEVLPANRMFHFMPSHTCRTNGSRPFPNHDLESVDETVRKYYTRMGMLTSFGISHRLKDYDENIIQFLKQEFTLFKDRIKPFIKSSFYHSIKKGSSNFHVYKRENEYLLIAFTDGKQEITFHKSELGLVKDRTYYIEDIDLKTINNLDSAQYTIHFGDERVKTYLIK